jgi:hypothetical protein
MRQYPFTHEGAEKDLTTEEMIYDHQVKEKHKIARNASVT